MITLSIIFYRFAIKSRCQTGIYWTAVAIFFNEMLQSLWPVKSLCLPTYDVWSHKIMATWIHKDYYDSVTNYSAFHKPLCFLWPTKGHHNHFRESKIYCDSPVKLSGYQSNARVIKLTAVILWWKDASLDYKVFSYIGEPEYNLKSLEELSCQLWSLTCF